MRFEKDLRRFPNSNADEDDVKREVIEIYFDSDDMRAIVGRSYDGSDEWWTAQTTTDMPPSKFISVAGNTGHVYPDSEAQVRYNLKEDEVEETRFMFLASRKTQVLGTYDVISVERGLETDYGTLTYFQNTANEEYDHVLTLQGTREERNSFIDVLSQGPAERTEAEAIFRIGFSDLERLDYNHYQI